MPKETKGWSAARRAKQAANCRKSKPWQHSTGPKTDSGKAASSANALKHGLRTADIRALSRLLTEQAVYIKSITSRLACENMQDTSNGSTET